MIQVKRVTPSYRVSIPLVLVHLMLIAIVTVSMVMSLPVFHS